MIQECKHCGDFYRSDDDEIAIDFDDGWVSAGWVTNACRQCQTEFHNSESLDLVWEAYSQELCEHRE